MNDPLTAIEQQLASHTPAGAPDELRDAVLRGVRRELKSASWDRRLARTAATLLAVGIGVLFHTLATWRERLCRNPFGSV